MSSCVSGLVLGSVQQEAKEYIWKRKMIQVFNVPPIREWTKKYLQHRAIWTLLTQGGPSCPSVHPLSLKI